MYRAAFNFARHVVKDTSLAMGVVAFAEVADLTTQYAGKRISLFAKEITRHSNELNGSQSLNDSASKEAINQPPRLA